MGGCCGEDIPVMGKHSLLQTCILVYYKPYVFDNVWNADTVCTRVLLVENTFHTQESTFEEFELL